MKKPQILYEDKYLFAIDKPAGMVVNRALSVKGDTVQDWIEKNFSILNFQSSKNKETDFERRNGIVHRIDKETSGVLLVAKDKETFAALQAQFKNQEVEKTYISLCHGILKEKKGVVDAPVGRLPWNRERFGVFPGGRPAKSEYKVLKEYERDGEKYSLVEWYPKTGRTHQIRVHAKFLGHPVVSDPFYAGRKTARDDRTWCPRLFLHAKKIVFVHPKTGKKIKIESLLPADLQSALP